jgi:hypothetical protein
MLTVDGADDPDNVDFAYETSSALGFTPFVSTRLVDGHVAPR